MIVSPGSSTSASAVIVFDVMSPAGTITQHRARLLELRREVLERGRAGRAVGLERLDRVRRDVVADAGVPVVHEPADDPGAHPAEPDHSELHGSVRGHR